MATPATLYIAANVFGTQMRRMKMYSEHTHTHTLLFATEQNEYEESIHIMIISGIR